MDKTILVIGASGMLGATVGGYFRQREWEVIELSRERFEIGIDPPSKLGKYLRQTKTVINCAGITKPRLAHTPVEEVVVVNAVFPHQLARLCVTADKLFFHITTDCVFSGRRGGYTEEDMPDAGDLYGLTKAAGETREGMTLRTSFVGEEKATQQFLLEWARSQKGKSIPGFVNQKWNGITTLYLAQIIERIVAEGLYRQGIFHIFSPEKVTKYKLLNLLNKVYDLGIKVQKVHAAESYDRSLATIYPLSSQVADKPLKRQLEEMRDFFQDASK